MLGFFFTFLMVCKGLLWFVTIFGKEEKDDAEMADNCQQQLVQWLVIFRGFLNCQLPTDTQFMKFRRIRKYFGKCISSSHFMATFLIKFHHDFWHKKGESHHIVHLDKQMSYNSLFSHKEVIIPLQEGLSLPSSRHIRHLSSLTLHPKSRSIFHNITFYVS